MNGEGSSTNGVREDMFTALYNKGFAPLLCIAPQYSTPQFCPKEDNGEEEKIVIGPAGDEAKKFLEKGIISKIYKNPDNIVILDNFKCGNKLCGHQIVSKKQLKDLNIKKGLILHKHPDRVRIFSEIFRELGIKELPFKTFSAFNGVFINKNHDLFKKYYDRKNFTDYFFSDVDEIVQTIFLKENYKKIYKQEDFLASINNIENTY